MPAIEAPVDSIYSLVDRVINIAVVSRAAAAAADSLEGQTSMHK